MMRFNNIYFVMKEFPQLEFKIINVSRGVLLRRAEGGLDVSVLWSLSSDDVWRVPKGMMPANQCKTESEKEPLELGSCNTSPGISL